jgi:hypothetical protein
MTGDFLVDVRRRLHEGRHDAGAQNSTEPYWQMTDLALQYIALIPHLPAALAWLSDRCPEVYRQLHGEWPDKIVAVVGVVSLQRFFEILESWICLHDEIAAEWFCNIRPHREAESQGNNP